MLKSEPNIFQKWEDLVLDTNNENTRIKLTDIHCLITDINNLKIA
jgi:hypothetical protein